MRIACVHFPQFPMQSLVREAPSRRRNSLAVVDEAGRTVVACNQLAHERGTRAGMPPQHVRSKGVHVESADADRARRAEDAAFDAISGVAPEVERGRASGPHLAMFVRVPAGMRGTTFGARLVAALEGAGFVARVGIADDRFTAWVAALDSASAVNVIASGGSAAYLADQPLMLLPIPEEVRHMLALGGVTTLGAFAALPPPSVARTWDADYQALARGEGGSHLSAAEPTGPIDERLVSTDETESELTVRTLVHRVATRLAGRGELQRVTLDVLMSGDMAVRIAVEPVPASAPEIEAALLEAVLPVASRGIFGLRAVAAASATSGTNENVVALASSALEREAPFVGQRGEPRHRRLRRGRTTHDVVARQALLFAER